MKAGLFITLALIASCAYATDFPEEDGVLVLKESNFEEAINHFEYILVEFYAPWCGHCKQLAPEYSKAAKALKESESPIALAKVDATTESGLAQKYEVQGYPTLKFFVNKQPIEYTGGRTQSEIVSWVRRKTQPSTTESTTADGLNKLINDNQVTIVFYGESASGEFSEFQSVSKAYDDLVFSHVFDTELRNSQISTTAPRIILYKKFDEGKNEFTGNFNQEEIKRFIDDNQYPVIMPFDQKSAQRIFGESKPALFLLYAEDERGQSAVDAFQAASASIKGQILLSKTTIDDGLGKRLADYIGVEVSDLPTVRLINFVSDDIRKFTLDGEITSDNIIRFFEEFNSGNLKPVFKSEEIPESNDESVKVIVGKSFNDIVLDPTKDVLVEFYAPWCGHCKSLAPIYESLAKNLAYLPNLIIAKVDATVNEIEGVSIQGFPTIKFWPANNKSSPLDFEGDRTEEGFVKFLREQLGERWQEKREEL